MQLSLLCLGVGNDGLPIYTITSSEPRPFNKPDEGYVSVIVDALKKEFLCSEAEAKQYIKKIIKE